MRKSEMTAEELQNFIQNTTGIDGDEDTSLAEPPLAPPSEISPVSDAGFDNGGFDGGEDMDTNFSEAISEPTAAIALPIDVQREEEDRVITTLDESYQSIQGVLTNCYSRGHGAQDLIQISGNSIIFQAWNDSLSTRGRWHFKSSLLQEKTPTELYWYEPFGAFVSVNVLQLTFCFINDGTKDVWVAFLRTMCPNPRIDGVKWVQSMNDGKGGVQLIKDFKSQRSSRGSVSYDTVTPIGAELQEKIINAYYDYLVKYRWIYVASRGLPRDCRNPQQPDTIIHKKSCKNISIVSEKKRRRALSPDVGTDDEEIEIVEVVESLPSKQKANKKKKFVQKAVKKNAKKNSPYDACKRMSTNTEEESGEVLLSIENSKQIQLRQQLLQSRIEEESLKSQRLQEELSQVKLAATATFSQQSHNNLNVEPIIQLPVQSTVRALPFESPQPLRCLSADSAALILDGKAATPMITDNRNGKLLSLLMQSMVENAVSQERERYAVQQLQEQKRNSMHSEIINLLSSFNK